MSDYSLLKQVYACASVCDEVTEAAIEAQIVVGTFPHGVPPRNRRFERGAVAADANANQVELANQAVGTLTQFLDWYNCVVVGTDNSEFELAGNATGVSDSHIKIVTGDAG